MPRFTWVVVVVAVVAAQLCNTRAEATIAATANASATDRGLIVAGKRFFPLMLIDQCDPGAVAHERTFGINLVINESCPGQTAQQQLDSLQGKALAVLPIGAREARGAGLAGWTYPDEPDNNGWTPASLAKAQPYNRRNADGLVTFVTTSGRFFSRTPTGVAGVPLAQIAGFARLADMAGFDLYPLNACQGNLTAVYDAQRLFARLAGATPTFQWIETGPIRPGYCGGFGMTAEELNAEVWLAVIGGARGIGYFTHTFSPADRPFDVTPQVQQAMAQTNALLNSVSPGLLGATLQSKADSPVVKVLARTGRRRTYVFAINTMRSPTKAQIHVPRLVDGPVTVVGEQRTVIAKDHSLIDHFGGLQVNVYVQSH